MATLLNPEQQQRLSILRSRQDSGEITLEEMREAVLILRQGRVSAQAASDSSKRKKAAAAIPNADDMLNELEGL